MADEFDRVIAFDFDISCTDGSERLVGRLFEVVYNATGGVVSFQATINGNSCSYPS